MRSSNQLAVVAIAVSVIAVPLCALSQSAADAMAAWGMARLDSNSLTTTPARSNVNDYFGTVSYSSASWWPKHALAVGGTHIETAGGGSWWVYDRVHHIAAASEEGDVTGDAILYSGPPPEKLPERDLSHVVSRFGLFLGIPEDRAERILGVSIRAVKQVSPDESILSVREYCLNRSVCADHVTDIFFRNGRAMFIRFGDLGP